MGAKWCAYAAYCQVVGNLLCILKPLSMVIVAIVRLMTIALIITLLPNVVCGLKGKECVVKCKPFIFLFIHRILNLML